MEMLGSGKQRRRTILSIKKTENRWKEENIIIPILQLRNFSTKKRQRAQLLWKSINPFRFTCHLGIVLPAGYSQNIYKSLPSPPPLPFTCFCVQMHSFIIAVKTLFVKRPQRHPTTPTSKEILQGPAINRRTQYRKKNTGTASNETLLSGPLNVTVWKWAIYS